MIKKISILLFIGICFSCDSNNGGIQRNINLKVDGCFDKFERNIKICLDSIFNDSRCPTGLVCVWEGDVMAAFTLTNYNVVSNFNLHLNDNFQKDTIIAGIAIKLLQITPYPEAYQSINPNDYKAEIRIDEN